MITTCVRCGWEWDEALAEEMEIVDWPEGAPEPPPLPEEANPHPRGKCPCHIKVGDPVYWDLGNSCPDLPPVRAIFRKIESFEGPEFTLQEDNSWALHVEAIGRGVIEIDKSSVHPGVLASFPKLLEFENQVVFIDDLTAMNKWPVIIPTD